MNMRVLATLSLVTLCCASIASSETLEWTRQLGTNRGEKATGVSADGLGSVYMAGHTQGTLAGANAGSNDAFLSKYDATGNLAWIQQFGTSSDDRVWGVSADGLGSVYISGDTFDSLEGTNAGGTDACLVKFSGPLLGDVDLNGEVNGLDVDPFVEVLLSGPYQPEADMNEDGPVNGLDVDPLVAAVVGGGAAAVPEPSALLLCIIAFGVGGWRKCATSAPSRRI